MTPKKEYYFLALNAERVVVPKYPIAWNPRDF